MTAFSISRAAGAAARARHAAVELLAFLWAASALGFCVLIMALFFLV